MSCNLRHPENTPSAAAIVLLLGLMVITEYAPIPPAMRTCARAAAFMLGAMAVLTLAGLL